MSERVCPRWRCAELNPPDAVDCQACGCSLVPRALGDLQPKVSVFNDPEWRQADQDSWDHRKALAEGAS